MESGNWKRILFFLGISMHITKNILIDLLNMDLELEYSSAIQYINHASIITRQATHWNISKEIAIDALEEMQHAVILANQISHLGGVPSVNVGRVFTSKNETEMLNQDFQSEEDSVRRYKVRVTQAEMLREFALAQHLQFILEMEQEHAMDFKYKQCLRQRERNIPIMEIMDHGDFSTKWAQRAMQVPIRTKKYQ